MNVVRGLRVSVAALAAVVPCIVYATNGMNLEGYGPEALGAGGAALAYDNGSAATMNNPATIGLMPDGHRSDFALGFLGPDVSAKTSGMTANSSGDAYYMPALGWVSKRGQFAYGFGMFAQGGMGTDYKGDSFMAANSGEKVRSELGVGRLMVPLSFEVSPGITIGGSVDFVWAGLDLKMALTGAQFGDMVASLGGTQSAGTASGTAVDGLVSNIGTLLNDGTGPGDGLGTGPINWARFDFSNSSPYTGEAMGTGFAGKIGAVFKVNPQSAIGVTYHTKTALSDLESSDTTLSMSANVDTGMAAGGPASGTYAMQTIEIDGKIKVKNFEWPAMLGVGAAFQATNELMIVADVKRIFWADVMKSFKMSFTADSAQSGLASGFASSELDAKLYQKWEDQTVLALGGAYKATPEATLRLGYNRASNPIPNKYLNALFPAIQESHVTAGVGYAFNNASSVDFALSKGLDTSATNPGNGSTSPAVKSTMSQLNWQLMYSHRY